MLGSPTRALNELVSEERERVIELLAALTASSDLVEQQRCQISDLKHALQARVTASIKGFLISFLICLLFYLCLLTYFVVVSCMCLLMVGLLYGAYCNGCQHNVQSTGAEGLPLQGTWLLTGGFLQTACANCLITNT